MREWIETAKRAGTRRSVVAPSVPLPDEGRRRVVITSVRPHVEPGPAARGPVAIKRCVGDVLRVETELVCDGHDLVRGVIAVRRPGRATPIEVPLIPRGNDRFVAEVALDAVGRWEITVEAWVDAFESWRHGFERKVAEAGADAETRLAVDLAIGARLVRAAAARAKEHEPADADALTEAAAVLDEDEVDPPGARLPAALAEGLASLAARYPDRRFASRSAALPVVVDPVHARFAAWYELFPRSTGEGLAHGTFRTAEAWLPYVADLGFDTIYLPPIHPIGVRHRKGPNNTLVAGPDDVGSPWAIGGAAGGHTAVHPALGTLEDFDRFVGKAREHGLRVALDVAFQASPDHPWTREHPSWFVRRPDGTMQYAENPPKKYQDVLPFDFEGDDWHGLWIALRDVFLFWIARGVTVFRVDNPHTKPLPFWAWCIEAIKAEHPEVTFLAEAFTRPSLKYALAKAGFTQGYTYFTWRHTPAELRAYMLELTRGEVREVFRPSFWPNTPDILPDDLQSGARGAFLARLILAGTLSSHYGVYGPAFELMEHVARPGSGEYQDNEKYVLKDWDRDAAHSLAPVIRELNRIRRAHPALQANDSIVFHGAEDERVLVYSKRAGEDVVLCVVTMDPHHRAASWLDLDLEALGVAPGETFQVHDLLGGGRYLWSGPRAYVELDPHAMPAQLFALRRKARSEHDFDYYL